MTSPKSDLPQGTLDMLILQIIALGPIHGYASAYFADVVSPIRTTCRDMRA